MTKHATWKRGAVAYGLILITIIWQGLCGCEDALFAPDAADARPPASAAGGDR